MNYYSATILIIVMAMVIMAVSIILNSSFSKGEKGRSLILVLLVILCSICEWGGVTLERNSTNLVLLHKFVKTFELCATPFLGLIASRIPKKGKPNCLDWCIFSVCVLNAILEIVSFFTGFIFNVDANNAYTHESCYFIYLVSYMIGALYFIYTVIRSFQRKDIAYAIPNVLVILFISASVIIQLVNSSLKIDWLSICISVILFLKFYGDILANTDGLTGLLNRLSFENQIKKLKKPITIIFFDIDSFKEINDKYGHVYGDECLEKVSNDLKNVYDKYGKIYRYGGDEFCILLKDEIVEDALSEKFLSLIKKEKELDYKFPDVSFGHAHYDPAADNILDILDEADHNMYQNKHDN